MTTLMQHTTRATKTSSPGKRRAARGTKDGSNSLVRLLGVSICLRRVRPRGPRMPLSSRWGSPDRMDIATSKHFRMSASLRRFPMATMSWVHGLSNWIDRSGSATLFTTPLASDEATGIREPAFRTALCPIQRFGSLCP